MLRLVVLAVVLVAAHGAMLGGFEEFMRSNKKEYSEMDYEFRKQVFNENMDYIRKHNSGGHSFELGVNEYADWTRPEFVDYMNGFVNVTKTSKPTKIHTRGLGDLPDMVDWRQEGYVTEIKNQKQCGSCWAFSTTGSLEGQHFKKTGQLVSLSEQNLVDCSRKQGNMGCQGGLMDQAFEYIKLNNGDDTEMSYPYEAKNGMCRFNPETVGATDTGYVDVASMDEMALKDAVATIGPVSVAIDASRQSFQLYKSGVYNEPMCSSTKLDHGVLVVGYGTENGQDYWLVKNSWGMTWGMEGYIKMARNMNNMCGIATSASYPLV